MLRLTSIPSPEPFSILEGKVGQPSVFDHANGVHQRQTKTSDRPGLPGTATRPCADLSEAERHNSPEKEAPASEQPHRTGVGSDRRPTGLLPAGLPGRAGGTGVRLPVLRLLPRGRGAGGDSVGVSHCARSFHLAGSGLANRCSRRGRHHGFSWYEVIVAGPAAELCR
jgi:hypothetical protein